MERQSGLLRRLEAFDFSRRRVHLLGIIIFGSSDKYSEKILASTRAAVWAQGMRADGAIIFSEGSGNNHVDFANACEQLGRRNIAVSGLTVLGKNAQFVVNNDYMNNNIVDVCKSKGSVEPCIIGKNNLSHENCKNAVEILKREMKISDGA